MPELLIFVPLLVLFAIAIWWFFKMRSVSVSDHVQVYVEPAALAPEGHAGAAAQVGIKKKKGDTPYEILVVDDQPAIRMLLAEVFQTSGFIIHEAASGREAIEKFRAHPTDVILLDLKMPDMNGIETLRAIRAMDRDVKAVMISAYGDPDHIEEARRLGVERIFTKPFDIDKLRQYIQKELNVKG
jgi:two-component system response regulator (stage 0 sporulation protein F)